MEDLKDAIVNLNLELIPEDWVAEVWSNNFSEESSLPVELTNEICLDDLNEKILEAIVATKNCIKEGRQSVPGDNFNWQVLIDGDVPKKSLICFLSTFIKHDITEVNNGQIIIPALFAARLYVLLLCIPGAAVFNFFHPTLFDQCLGLLHIGNKLVTSISKPAKKSKSKKRQSNDDEDNANSEENTLTSAEKEEILQILCLYLTEMSECFEVVKLKGEVLSIDIIVKALIDIASLELKSNIFKNSPRLNTIGYAAWKAYSVLDKLCSEDHGSVREIIRIVFQAFTKFLYLKEENIRLSLKDDDTIRRINILSFILKLVEKHEEAAADNIIALLQQLLVRIPDKADIRGKATTEIVNFVESLSPKLIEDYSLWVVSLSFGDMVKHKVAAVELISKILTSKDNTENKRLHEILLTALLSNTLDKSSLVRYKCLNIFASNIFSTQPEIKDIITKLFVNAEDINNNDEVKHTDFFDFNSYFKECIKSKNFSLPPDNILPTGSRIIKLLEHFCFDDKVYVRKSALLALTNICILNKRWVNQLRLQILDIACKDLSVMIRKQMAKCVTDLLLTYPLHKGILETWVNGVVTLVTDNDVKSQEKVFEYIFEVIIGNITHASKEKSPINSLPWRILDTIAHKEKRKFLRLACRTWAIQKTIKEPVFNNIVSHIDTHNSYTAWFLIGCLSEFLDYPNPNFIYKYFSENVNLKNSGNDTLDLLVIEALFLNWRGTKLEIQEKLFDDLKLSLEEFRTPHHLIARSLDILFQMKRTETIEWCAQLTNLSGKYISSVMIPENTNAINSTILSRYVFTLGEAALFHPGVDEKVINSVADIIESAGLSKRLRKSRVDLKAVGVVTLAKLCLQDLFLAKQYVPKLANLLNDASTSVIVKVNTLAGLADLCVRFTSVVEDYLGNFCLALKDSSEEVRKSALEHIMQLIMEDYLKLKSPLFYYLSTMLLDPSTEIKEIYESFIMNCVLKKQPSIMTHFFIQALFFFNDFEGKKGFYNDEMSENEQILFGLAGVNNFENREKIYKFMLKAMQDDHRFKIQNRICIDILDSVCEDKIVLNIVGNAVLKDALNVMACQEMRLEHLRKDDEEQPAEDNAEDNFVMGMARKIILSQILKKNYVESLVPVVARLRKKLMALKSPLTKDLMNCLTEIMKDFKQEINEIFAADPQLAAEVEFDLRNSADSSIIEQLGDAEPEIQEKISCISQLAIGSENIGGFMNTTIQQLMGSDDDGPLSPPSVPLSHSQDSSKLSEPSTSSELITSASLSLTTSKIDSVRKSLPVLKSSVELSSASSDPSTSNTDVSTEYSYNIPVSSIPPATKINFTSSSNDSSTLSSSSSNKKSTRRKRKK